MKRKIGRVDFFNSKPITKENYTFFLEETLHLDTS